MRMTLKTFRPLGIMIMMLAVLAGCSDHDIWDKMPDPISKFITTYFPNQEVIHYSKTDDAQTVAIKNGVTMKFNDQNSWVDINGNGGVLPQILLDDQLPEPLYRYLQEMEVTNGVYRIERNAEAYIVELKDSAVRYVIATGEIFYPSAPKPTTPAE